MKKLSTVFAFVLLMTGTAHTQEEPMVDGPADDQVKQLVTFKGKPGVKAEAAIVQLGSNTDPSLLITHSITDDVRSSIIIDNTQMGFNANPMAGQESTLAVAKNGSLLIQTANESIGRNRWSRTLTVAYRGGRYVVVGFTYASRDSLDPEAGESCDYNLLTGSGTRDGRKVKTDKKPIDLAMFKDSEKYYGCK